MPELAYVALATTVVLAGALSLLWHWPFPPSLSVAEIVALASLCERDQGSALAVLSSFYEWRQDQWRQLARGFGALAVAVLLALVGATLEADTVVTERTLEQKPGGSEPIASVKTTTTEAATSSEAIALIGAFVVLASAAWLRARAVQSEFPHDVRRVGELQP